MGKHQLPFPSGAVGRWRWVTPVKRTRSPANLDASRACFGLPGRKSTVMALDIIPHARFAVGKFHTRRPRVSLRPCCATNAVRWADNRRHTVLTILCASICCVCPSDGEDLFARGPPSLSLKTCVKTRGIKPSSPVLRCNILLRSFKNI